MTHDWNCTLNEVGNVWKFSMWHVVSWALTATDLPESICNPWPWQPSDHWTMASELVTDKSEEVGERIKANWEVEKPTSTNNEVQSGHQTASCMLGAAWWSAAWATRREKSGQCMARPCHGGLIKKLLITCLSKMFIFRAQHRGAALSDNTAPKIFHVKRQTQSCSTYYSLSSISPLFLRTYKR